MKIFATLFNRRQRVQNPIDKLPVFRQRPELTDDKVTAYRTAAYAIITRDSIDLLQGDDNSNDSKKSSVLGLKNSGGIFLPGGGVDEIDGLAENIPRRQFIKLCESTIEREVEEEIGSSTVYLSRYESEAIQIFYSKKAHKVIKQRCVFFMTLLENGEALDAAIQSETAVSPDNTGKIIWVAYPYQTNWFHQAQKHAVINALKTY